MNKIIILVVGAALAAGTLLSQEAKLTHSR